MNRAIQRLLLALVFVAAAVTAQSQSISPAPAHSGEFSFARLRYQGNNYMRSRWSTDYDSAEYFFRQGVERLSRVSYGGDIVIDPIGDEIMNYPWLYAVEVGSWYLSQTEAELLREYLMRGGFLVVDDFWGSDQWLLFEDSMKRVFPDRPIVDIGETDALMSVVYDLEMDVQIPGVSYIRSGVTYQQDGYEPYWKGIFDDEGRLMVAINQNMDMGDAWEHADNSQYPQEMTTLALHFAVNYVIYAMTH